MILRCVSWRLTPREKHGWRRSEKSAKEDICTWVKVTRNRSVLQDEKLCNLYPSPHIIEAITWRRLRWAECVEHTGNARSAHRIFVGRHERKGSLGDFTVGEQYSDGLWRNSEWKCELNVFCPVQGPVAGSCEGSWAAAIGFLKDSTSQHFRFFVALTSGTENIVLSSHELFKCGIGHSHRQVWVVSLDRSDVGIKGSSPAQGVDICLCLSGLGCSVYVYAFRLADFSSKESHQMYK
jgi:hypothetical protein